MSKTFAVLATLVLAACGGGDDGGGTSGRLDAAGNSCTDVIASCTFNNDPKSCQEEHAGISQSDYKQICETNGGAYSTDPCGRGGSVGGCQDASIPGCPTAWYFAPQTADQIRLACTNSGGKFLTP